MFKSSCRAPPFGLKNKPLNPPTLTGLKKTVKPSFSLPPLFLSKREKAKGRHNQLVFPLSFSLSLLYLKKYRIKWQGKREYILTKKRSLLWWGLKGVLVDGNMGLKLVMWNVLAVAVLCSWVCSVEASVSYDSKAIVINGQRRILISGSVHYPRSSPEV